MYMRSPVAVAMHATNGAVMVMLLLSIGAASTPLPSSLEAICATPIINDL
jgi:hypothetical protein